MTTLTLDVPASVWGLVAERLLQSEENLQEDNGVVLTTNDIIVMRRDTARSFFNLMLTCRELYHELPWTMPKWCLADVFETLVNNPAHTPARPHRAFETWIDRFQRNLGQLSQSDSSTAVWMENRFIVYSWLGTTWDSECTFLRARLRSPASTPDFWDKFGRFGRVDFTRLQRLTSWDEDAAAREQLQPSSAQRATDTGDDGEDGHDDACAQATSLDARDDNEQQDKQQLNQQQHQVKPQDQQQHVPQQQDTQHQQQRGARPAPALFSLKADLFDQEDADRVLALRTTLLANALGNRMTLSVIKPLLSLTASNVRHLTIVAPSAKIDKLSVHHVERMTWDTAAEEVTFDADFRDVQHICLRRLGHRADFSALAGIPCVELASDDAANSFDLAPLEGVKHLALRNTRVLGEEPVILAAQRLDLTGVNLEAAKLHANRVQLCRMAAAPELLHLPNATHIELLEDCKVKRITCPLHIERLVIRHPNTHAGAAPVELPQFEHAGTVVLDFGGAKLTRAQLTSLGARSDHLVLCNCVNNIRDLCDVPPHVYVCVAGAHVDAEVPLCVKELKASIKSSFRASFVRTVPYLMLSGQRTMKAIPDTNNLSDHVFLSLKACAIDGAIRNCLRASIDGCVGRATFNCIGALSIHHGDLAFTRFERADFEVEGVEDVCTCRLWHCDIDEPFSLRATQRLIVRVSTFYEAIVVEPVNTLVVRGCGSGYGNGRWPYATLARPTHERTQLMERLREKDRVEWERRREEESWEDWSPLFDDTEYESDDDDDGDEDADGDDDGDDDDDGDGGGEDDDSDDGEC